jgi:hypothetical protein
MLCQHRGAGVEVRVVMVEERNQARPVAAAQDEATRLGHQARHAWDAWAASKLPNERTDVEGVKLKRGEVAYYAIEDAGLVEMRRAELPTVTDTGSFVVTNQRCVFVGSNRSTEWAYSKLLDYSLDGEAVAMFNVSNRQKATGVKYSVEIEPQVDATIAAAIARFRGEDEHAALVNALHEDHRRAFAEWEVAGSHVPPTA